MTYRTLFWIAYTALTLGAITLILTTRRKR